MMEKHKQRALKWEGNPADFWKILSERGKKAVNSNEVLDDFKCTSHLDIRMYPCMRLEHRSQALAYSHEFCQPLEKIATWGIRHRHADGEAVRLSVTMTNQTNPTQVTECLISFFSSLQQSFTGHYDLLTESDQKLIRHSMEETDATVAQEVSKLHMQQLYETNALPTTPEPEFQQGPLPWYHDYLEPYASNTGKEVFENGVNSSSTVYGERWTKLPLPCASDLRIGHIWMVGCRAEQLDKILKEFNRHEVTLVLRCDTTHRTCARAFTTSQRNFSTAVNSSSLQLTLLPWFITGTESDKLESCDFNMITQIVSEISKRKNVLLCCDSGLTHSAVQACKVLMLFNGCGLERAAAQLLRSRPAVRINRAQLQEFENELYGLKVVNGTASGKGLNLNARSSVLSWFSKNPLSV